MLYSAKHLFDDKLTKIRICAGENDMELLSKIAHPLIVNQYLKLGEKPGVYYTNGLQVLYQEENSFNSKRIPTPFINAFYQPIYKSINSFSQNVPVVSKKVKYSVMELLSYDREILERQNLIGIGGEFIGYFVNAYFRLSNYVKFYGYTNNKSIATDANYNINQNLISLARMNIFYHKNYEIIYNELDNLFTNIIKRKTDVIINLSKIHLICPDILIKNKKKINRIIVISCNEKNLKMRFDYNTGFKLVCRNEIINPVNEKKIMVSYFKLS